MGSGVDWATLVVVTACVLALGVVVGVALFGPRP